MDNFKIIYKILKILEKSMDVEDFDKDLLSAEQLGISYARWCRIMNMLVSNDYITGVEVWNSMDCNHPKAALTRPELTLKGLEYLEENTFMKKAADLAKGIKEVIPGL